MGDIKRFIIGAVLVGLAFTPLGALSPILKSLLISTGLSLASAALLIPTIRSRQTINERNVADPLAGLPVVYGTARVGLRLSGRQFSADGRFMYIVGALCHGSSDGNGIQGIDEIYFDNKLAVNAAGVVQSPWTGRVVVTKYLGTDTQNVDATLNSNFATAWPTTSRGRGVVYVVVRLQFDPEVFVSVPNITVNVRGCRVFDTRDDTWKFSDNPWLCVRDYLVAARYGLGAAGTEIHEASFEAEANYADELMTIPEPYPGGGTTTERRFTCNGWLDTDQSIEENVRQLLTSCRGNLVTQGGQFRAFTRRQVTPTTFTLSERNIVGDWSFGLPGVTQKLNQVGYAWIDPADHFQPKNGVFPVPGGANSYLTADNGYVSRRDLELPFTTSPYMARRSAETEIRESREAISVQLTAFEEALQLQVGDVVPVTHETPGFSNKNFWVLAVAFDPESRLVRIALSEYDLNAYQFDGPVQLVPAPNTNLPSPTTVVAPTSATIVYTGADALDGAGKPRLQWVASTDAYLDHYEVEYRIGGVDPWYFAGRPKRADIESVLPSIDFRESFEARVRAINTLGVASAWATAAAAILAPRRFDLGRMWTFETDIAHWPLIANVGGAESYPSDGQAGGRVYQATGYRWREGPAAEQLPFDPSKLLRIRARVRRTADAGAGPKEFYCGFVGIAADGVTRVNFQGADSTGSQHYVCASSANQEGWTVNTWVEYTGWVLGWAAGDGATTPSADPRSPRQLHANVRYIRPVFIVNYQAGATLDTVQLDYIAIDIFDEEAQERLYESLNAPGSIDPVTVGDDGAGGRKILKGLQIFFAQHGDNLSFNPVYQNPPKSIVLGGRGYNAAGGGEWYPHKMLQNVLPGSAQVVCQLRQAGAPTTQNHDFLGNLLDAVDENENVVLSNAPASNNTYTVRVHIRIVLRSKTGGLVTGTLRYRIRASNDGGSNWTAAQVTETVVFATDSLTDDTYTEVRDTVIAVAGLDSTDRIEVRFLDFTVQGVYAGVPVGECRGANNGTYAGRGVTYITSTDTFVTATDASNPAIVLVFDG